MKLPGLAAREGWFTTPVLNERGRCFVCKKIGWLVHWRYQTIDEGKGQQCCNLLGKCEDCFLVEAI